MLQSLSYFICYLFFKVGKFRAQNALYIGAEKALLLLYTVIIGANTYNFWAISQIVSVSICLIYRSHLLLFGHKMS